MSELDDIRARRAAITPGVWEPRISKETTDHEVTMYDAEIDYTVTVAVCNSTLRYMDNEPNARFIAAAPGDVDTLLAMVERLTGERDECRHSVGPAMQTMHQAQGKLQLAIDTVVSLTAERAALTAERDALAQQLQQAQDAATVCRSVTTSRLVCSIV